MIAFVCAVRPRSVGAGFTAKYKDILLAACKEACSQPGDMGEPLYGVVYYFHRRKTELDADNLSKPVWDALEKHLYVDDRVIKYRQAGVIDLGTGLQVLDLTRMPTDAAEKLIRLGVDEEHVLYVEIGKARPSLFTTGLEAGDAA